MHEIAAITGHASLSEVQRYTKAVSSLRKRLSQSHRHSIRTLLFMMHEFAPDEVFGTHSHLGPHQEGSARAGSSI